MSEFAPVEGGKLNRESRTGLLAEGIMPTAVVRLDYVDEVSDENDPAYTYATLSYETSLISGLVIFDLAGMDPDESVEHYVAFRMRRRYGLRVPETQLEFLNIKSGVSPTIRDLGNSEHSYADCRVYFPVMGITDSLPRVRRYEDALLLVKSGLVMEVQQDSSGDEYARHWQAVQEELMSRPNTTSVVAD